MSDLDHCPRCAWDRIESEHNAKMAERRRIERLLLTHFAIARDDRSAATFFAEFDGVTRKET